MNLQTTPAAATKFFQAHDHCAEVNQANGAGMTTTDANHNHVVGRGQDGKIYAMAVNPQGQVLDHWHLVTNSYCGRNMNSNLANTSKPGGCNCGK